MSSARRESGIATLWLPSVRLAVVATVLALTLLPTSDGWTRYDPWCVLCGERVTTDVLTNLLLFLPLGAAVAYRASGRWHVVLLGAALSLFIEVLQTQIPGRDPSVRDVIANTLGTAIGVGLVVVLPRWAAPDRWSRARALLLALLPGAVVALSGWLLVPDPNLEDTTFSHWSPRAYGFRPGAVTVLHVALDGQALPTGRIDDTAKVRAALVARHSLHVEWRHTGPLEADASVFALLDRQGRWTFLLGQRGEALIVRRPRRATRWRLETPTERLVLTTSRADGAHTLVATDLGRAPFCAEIDGRAQCAERFDAGIAWALLRWDHARSPASTRWLCTWTLVLLCLPLSWVLGAVSRPVATTSATIALSGIAAAALSTGLAPPSAVDLAAMCALLIYGAVRRRSRERDHGAPASVVRA